MELLIKKDQLKAALIFAAKKDLRKYLVAVHFDPDGFMVTTDGHRMLVQKVAAFDGESFTVPRAIIELAIKGCGKYGVIEVTRDKVANISYTYDDGQFPQWRKVIPDSINNEPGAYNADYVADIKAAQELLTGRNSWFTSLSIGQNGDAPAVFVLDDGAFGVIMKVRGLKWNNKRPNLIIGDDLEGDEQVESKNRRDKFFKWLMKASLPCGSDK